MRTGGKDKWGIPVLHIVSSYGENEKADRSAMRQDITNVLDAMDLGGRRGRRRTIAEHVRQEHSRVRHRARMGADPKTSVVDRDCRVHGVKNVFVSDGAVFTTQSCYEPTLTIMAISARVGEHVAEASRRGEL